jgi:hypothetical protein
LRLHSESMVKRIHTNGSAGKMPAPNTILIRCRRTGRGPKIHRIIIKLPIRFIFQIIGVPKKKRYRFQLINRTKRQIARDPYSRDRLAQPEKPICLADQVRQHRLTRAAEIRVSDHAKELRLGMRVCLRIPEAHGGAVISLLQRIQSGIHIVQENALPAPLRLGLFHPR